MSAPTLVAPPAAATSAATQAVTTAPSKRPARYPLDSVRAIAATAVLSFHAYQNNRDPDWPWTGWPHTLALASDAAVDLFFVVSGFLLWLPVAKAMLAGRPQRSGRRLLVRRAVRLLPLYVVVLLVAWSLANPVLPGHWPDLLAHLTMTHVYSDTYIFWTIGPAWTLAIEFHAYVLIALLMPLLGRLTPRLRTPGSRLAVLAGLPAAMVVVGVGYLAWSALVLRVPETDWSVWFGPMAKVHLFAVGMGLAVLAARGVTVQRAQRAVLVAAGIGLGAVGLATRVLVDGPGTELAHVAYAGAAAALVGAIVLHPGTQPAWLTWRPLVFVGTVSYSLYLVHELVMQTLRSAGLLPFFGTTAGVLVTAAATFSVALVIARLSYVAVERPLIGMVEGLERSDELYAHLGVSAARASAAAAIPRCIEPNTTPWNGVTAHQ